MNGKLYSNDDCYFDSYSHFGIHEEMLKDKTRTMTYRDAIMKNPHLFRDKVVLDVGSGTGILSMFCAKAGAKAVYGVDNIRRHTHTSNISHRLNVLRSLILLLKLYKKTIYPMVGVSSFTVVRRAIFFFPLFSSTIHKQKNILSKLTAIYRVVVKIIKGKLEEIELPTPSVDIIVSEWMGYCLLYESMLDTVIYARDKWLVEGGLIFPDKAHIYVCAIEDSIYMDDKINWWYNVYGFDMSCIRDMAINEPLVDVVESKAVVTNSCKVKTIDLKIVQLHELDRVDFQFDLVAKRNDYIHALLLYFTVDFSACHTPISLSTSPHYACTHWKQTVLYLHNQISICNGEDIKGIMALEKNSKNKREIDIHLNLEFNGSIEQRKEKRVFSMH